MTNGNNGTQLIGEIDIRIKEALDVGYAKPEIKTLVDINKNKLREYLGNYAVTKPVKVEVMPAAENGFLLIASPYVEMKCIGTKAKENSLPWMEVKSRLREMKVG